MTIATRLLSAPFNGAVAVSRGLGAVAGPLTGVLLHPVLGRVSALLDTVVPVATAALLRRIDLTELVRGHVDLDRLVAEVDLDAAAGRLDIDAVAQRLDVEAVIERLDLTAIVRERVDLDAVAQRLDVEAVIKRLDLTAIVREHVDLDAVVATVDLDAAASHVDIEAIIKRIDLVGLVEQVLDAIDLPEIIRESTGSVASETVRGVRMQGITADEAVSRAVDRLRLRRGRRHDEGDQP